MSARAEGFIVALVGFYLSLTSILTAGALGAHSNPLSIYPLFWLGIITIIGGILYAVFKSRYEVRRKSE